MVSRQKVPPTITAELRSWRLKSPQHLLYEGLVYNDKRGMYKDSEYGIICPDAERIDWLDMGTWFLVGCTDRFGTTYFRLDKNEEDKT